MPLLDPARLPPLLGAEAAHYNVDSVAETTSTNDELSRQVARRLLPSGSVLVADRQTAGKGRQGRQWASGPAASLTFSLYRRFLRSPQQMAGLSLAVGLGVQRGLAALGVQGVGLKWPNDLLRHGEGGWGKLGGVLIELSPGRHGVDAIIGIGLNLLPVAVSGARTACIQDGLQSGVERHAVLAAVLAGLRPALDAFEAGGLDTLKAGWESAHVWQGETVRAEQQGQPLVTGRCLGIDTDGALLLATASGVHRVQVGDISLRLPEAAT